MSRSGTEPARIALLAALCAWLVWLVAWSSVVRAQAVADAPVEAPPTHGESVPGRNTPDSDAPVSANSPRLGRVVATGTAGLALRLVQNDDYGQDTLAPFYADVLGGYVFGSSSAYQHGIGLGVSFNLSADGGYTEPVYPARQWALAPSYLGFLDLGADFFGLGHVGVPILLTDTQSVGLELGVGAAYRLLAGFGLYTELSFAAFFGASSTVHPLFCWELGLSLDYEVLP